MRKLPLLLSLLFVPFLFDSCVRNPVTGKRNFVVISEKQEIQMGEQYDPAVIAQFGQYDDPELQQLLTRLGQEIARESHRPNLPWKFTLLNDPSINAFALPGGKIYFTRGIMAHFNNEAQLAGVMGHEIGHVTARHSVRQQSKSTLYQGLLIGGMILSPEVAQMGEAAMQGLQLLTLKHSRDHEREADVLGVTYSTQQGYDAREMAGFFNTIERQTAGQGGRLPTLFSTHPNPPEREATVRQLATEMQQKAGKRQYEVDRDTYLRMLDGLMYGNNPREGFFENNAFFHPDLKFSFPVPRGWQTANGTAQVQMVEPDGQAALLLTLNAQKDLQAASQDIVQKYKLTNVSTQSTRVNGLAALALNARQVNQESGQTIALQSYLIEYNGNIYELHGLTTPDALTRFRDEFSRTQEGFAPLTDPEKLNRQPERIGIKAVGGATTLRAFLEQQRVPNNRLEEMAILNGMELEDRLAAGSLVKLVE